MWLMWLIGPAPRVLNSIRLASVASCPEGSAELPSCRSDSSRSVPSAQVPRPTPPRPQLRTNARSVRSKAVQLGKIYIELETGEVGVYAF